MASDASDLAVGVVLFDPRHPHPTSYMPLSPEERTYSSTWRELAAILFGLRAFRAELSGKQVRWLTDNQAAVIILNTGSRKPWLHRLAVEAY